MMPDMARTTKLYGVPASHPVAAVERALQLKGIDYQRVDLVPGSHVLLQKLRFGKRTVPGLAFADGTKVSGSRAILRELDKRVPEPRLVLDDPKVTYAEEWGDEVLQPLVRRVLWRALKESPGSVPSYTAGAKLPLPPAIANLKPNLLAVIAFERKLNKSTDLNVRADLLNLHEHLDRVDGWVEEGTIGGDAPNAADLQIASGLALLLTLDDLKPVLDAHRAADLARKWFPEYPGHTAAGALPEAWLPSAAPEPAAAPAP
jgi:glutathione S-transferase